MDDEIAVESAETEGISWRDLAVARSLDSARVRAESRVQRFLDAAMELLAEGSAKDFTVQEVVERSGQSLRSFYQYFSGKHELLLALFEESVRSTGELLRAGIAREDTALERLHRFVVEYYRLCRPVEDGATDQNERPPIMAEFAQQLLTTHPKEAARAFAPLVTLFEELLQEAAAADVVRDDLQRGPIIGAVLEVIMFNAFSATIGGSSVRLEDGASAEELWRFVLHGIGTLPRG
jgi:AcrR family transcriptional regulator